MTNWTELKRLAESIKEGCGLQGADAEEAMFNFECAATPETILALIAENEQYQEIMRVFVEEATCADWSGEDNESVFHTAQMWCGKYHQAKQDADQLRAEVETLRKDAERWRFLCDGDHQMIIAQMTEFDGVCEIGCDPIEYDFAIDSMMEKNA